MKLVKRTKTPEEIAKEAGSKRKGYRLYLKESNMHILQTEADRVGISVSKLWDEAAELYIERVLKKQSKL